MESIWGYSREEIEGRVKWPELVLEDDIGMMMEYHRLRRIDPDAAPKSYDFRFINKSGETRDASLVATIIPGTKKSIISIKDITEQKNAKMQMAAQHDLGIELTALSSLEEQETGDLILQYGVGISDSFRHAVSRFSSDLEITRRIMSGEQIYTTKDEFRHEFHDKTHNEGLTCICTLPVFFREEVIGCMYLASHTPDEISPSHISALETITAQIGNAIGRVLAEEEIRKLNQEQADIIEFLPDATFVIDRDGRVIAWNRAIAEMTGVIKEDIVGKGSYAYAEAFYGERRPILADIIPARDEVIESGYDLIKRNRENICGEVYLPLIYGGRGGHVWAKASLLYDADGNVTGAIESVRDISEKKQTEEELQRSEKFYRTLFESTSAPTVILGEDTTILLANSAYEKLSGYSKEDIEGDKSWTAFIVKEDLDRMKEYHSLRRGDSDTAPRNYEFRFIDKSKNLHDIYLTVAMIPGTKKSVASMLDITERKQAETALYEEREQLAVTLRSIGDGVIVSNTDGNVTMLNNVAQDLTGWSEQEAFGRPLSEVFHIINEKTRELCENPVEKVLQTGLVIGLANHTALIARDGTERSIADSGAPVRDKENRTIGVVLVFRDVTGEKRAEEALQQSEEHYRTLAESATDTIIMFNPEGLVTYINPVAADAVKMMQEEMIGKSPADLFPPEVGKKLMDNLMRVVRSKKPCSHEDKLQFASQEMWYDSRVVPVMSGSGEVESLIVISRDVTDRKQVEEALQESEEKYRDLFENANDLIQSVTPDGHFVYVNRAWRNNLGYIEEEIADLSLFDIIHPDSQAHCMEVFQRVMSGEKVNNVEAVFVAKDGKKISVAGNVNCKFVDGKPVYTRGIFRDITERKTAEQALEAANKKLQLLSCITRHDILNQIAALAGYTNLLSDLLPDDPEMREYIDRITKATSAVERQIKFTRDYEQLGVNPTLWQRVGDVAERAASTCAHIGGVHLSIATGALEVFADPMLEKVFLNLFDNALRHGEHVTEISVTCREEDVDRAVIAVKDNGVGVPAEMKERIFGDGFGRHTGYGLFLAQEILSITGISIRETSEEGKGACFEIIVPSGAWRRD